MASNSKKIAILIGGDTASGKTTISLIIEKALRDAGFEVTNKDFDVVNTCHAPEHQDRRVLDLAAAGLGVVIETKNVRK